MPCGRQLADALVDMELELLVELALDAPGRKTFDRDVTTCDIAVTLHPLRVLQDLADRRR